MKEEVRKPKSDATKAKKKASEKPKASRMDDSSDSDDGKGKPAGGKPAKLDGSSDSDGEDEQIPSGSKASKATAPTEPVNLMDDLLGMDVAQPAPV